MADKHLGSNGSSYSAHTYTEVETHHLEGVRTELLSHHGSLHEGEKGTIVGADPNTGDPVVNFDHREHSAIVPFSELGPA
jgi:hypothetical protein